MKNKNSGMRVYADTSVFGGVFEADFAKPSRAFFEQAERGLFLPVISSVVEEEIKDAPPQVRHFFHRMERLAEAIHVSPAALGLRDAYLNAGVVAPQWAADALHVALATAAACPVIVSWNFKHIVNFRKIPLYNAVNRLNGYGEIGIFTPQEVIAYGDEKI